MGDLLGKRKQAKADRAGAKVISDCVNKCMFDPNTGFYYDRQITEDAAAPGQCAGTLLTDRGRGPEGWSPLWAKIADKDKAAKVRSVMLDPNGFFVGSAGHRSCDEPGLRPEHLLAWTRVARPVLLRGHRVGQLRYKADANALVDKLLKNADGLVGDKPIRENYNPETGAMQGASNFVGAPPTMYMLYYDFAGQKGCKPSKKHC